MSAAPLIERPVMARMMSPGLTPARSATLPSLTESTTAAPGGTVSICMPSQLTGREVGVGDTAAGLVGAVWWGVLGDGVLGVVGVAGVVGIEGVVGMDGVVGIEGVVGSDGVVGTDGTDGTVAGGGVALGKVLPREACWLGE